jgi:Reverse transcriptase (RNA-dependent DNA polymerase)
MRQLGVEQETVVEQVVGQETVELPPVIVQEVAVQEPVRRYPLRNNRGPPKPYWDQSAHIVIEEPSCYREAVESDEADEWKRSMEEEMESIQKNNTWTLVPLPKGRKAVTCKWVLRVKYDQDGNVDRYKSRLVARGFTQKEGIDYEETFAPVAKFM